MFDIGVSIVIHSHIRYSIQFSNDFAYCSCLGDITIDLNTTGKSHSGFLDHKVDFHVIHPKAFFLWSALSVNANENCHI